MPSQTRSVCMPSILDLEAHALRKGGEAGPWAYVRGNALMPRNQWRCIVQTNQGYGHVTHETQPSRGHEAKRGGKKPCWLDEPCRRPW